MTTGEVAFLRRRALVCAILILTVGCHERRRPDILLITIDTLRADRLGVYGSRLGLTPNIDGFARGALVFDRAYAVTPITGPSLSSAFTSLYPHETKVTDNGVVIPAGVVTLAGLLHQNGYETAAVVSNPVLAAPQRFDAGFDTYDDALPEREKYRDEPARHAGRTTDAALERWRARGPKPLFLWVHYMDPHGPYEASEEFIARAERVAPAEDRDLPVNATNRGHGGIPRYQYLEGTHSSRDYLVRHLAAITSLDQELGRLLRDPAIARLERNGVICFTADHGEALGEHDTWFAHGENIYEEMLRIPWIVKGRGARPGRQPGLVSLIDLLPSLADTLGISADPTWRGQAAWRKPERTNRRLLVGTFPATSEAERHGVISAGATAILSQPGGWEYYTDPAQLVNRAPESVDALRPLARWLLGELQRNSLRGKVPDAPIRVLSPEVLRRLRSLGYLN